MAPDRLTMSMQQGRLLLQSMQDLPLSLLTVSQDGCLLAEFGHLWGGTGQASLSIESRWRVSRKSKVLVGSGHRNRRSSKQLGKSIGACVAHVDVGNDVPDLTVALDDDHRISSFHDGPGGPQWGLAINDASLLCQEIEPVQDAQPWVGVRGNRMEVEFTFEDDQFLVLMD